MGLRGFLGPNKINKQKGKENEGGVRLESVGLKLWMGQGPVVSQHCKGFKVLFIWQLGFVTLQRRRFRLCSSSSSLLKP